MMDSSDLHTCPLFFWGCGHFFQEALTAVALVGIRVRAMWLRRVTGARGVTWSSPPPASKPGPSQPQPAPSCRSAPFDCPDMEREREGERESPMSAFQFCQPPTQCWDRTRHRENKILLCSGRTDHFLSLTARLNITETIQIAVTMMLRHKFVRTISKELRGFARQMKCTILQRRIFQVW